MQGHPLRRQHQLNRKSKGTWYAMAHTPRGSVSVVYGNLRGECEALPTRFLERFSNKRGFEDRIDHRPWQSELTNHNQASQNVVQQTTSWRSPSKIFSLGTRQAPAHVYPVALVLHLCPVPVRSRHELASTNGSHRADGWREEQATVGW